MADPSDQDGQVNEENVSASPRSSPLRTSTNSNMNNNPDQDGATGDAGPSPRKMRNPYSRAGAVTGADNQSTDTKSSGLSGDSGGLVTISPKHKDPDRIKKDREREERVRQARERLEQERKKKLVDLQEQQRQAQENREKQLEMRRKKIEDLRRRDVERRAEVERRRRERELAERSRRETLLLKAEERVARYEAWKRSGQKGPPPGGIIPSVKHLSASTSVLCHKWNSDSSSTGAINQPDKPDSMLASLATPPSRPKSVMTLSASSTGSGTSPVKHREKKTPRKPRPASVGTSMPSFVTLEPPKSSPRSKSSDRLARERSRQRTSLSARRSEEKEKEEKKAGEKTGGKISRRTLDRLSTPRQLASVIGDGKESVSTPKRETNVVRRSTTREKTPKENSAKAQHPPAPASSSSTAATASTAAATTGSGTASPSTPVSRTPSRTPVRVVSPTPASDEDGGSNMPSTRSTPVVMERSTGDISAEEYKAKLAEKRRQAREKAEKEAEEERLRQEELQRQEEERQRLEEEEQRRQDEEALRMAEEARRAEEERLQKAIEAEDARKAEEAARLEQERIAKEEAERKAKEEAERLEKERQEKARKDEEERIERKKRLEMIMKRVKTEGSIDGSKDISKSLTSSPSKSVNSTASSDTSPTDPDNKTVLAMAAQSGQPSQDDVSPAKPEETDNLNGAAQEVSETQVSGMDPTPVAVASDEQAASYTAQPENVSEMTDNPEQSESVVSDQVPATPTTPQPDSNADKPKFKSPLLQKLVEGKEETGSSPSGGPRFKSPLLQNLLGKTKLRSSVAQEHSMSAPNLSQMETSTSEQMDSDAVSSGLTDIASSDSSHKEVMNRSEEKDIDTSEDSSSSHSSPSHTSKTVISNGNESGSIAASMPSPDDSISAVQAEPMEISTPMETSAAPVEMATSSAFWSEHDSGVSFGSAAPSSSLQVSFNGHGPTRTAQGQGLEDSSISMRSIESVTSSVTDSAAGSVYSSVSSLPHSQVLSSADKEFEELIHLPPVNNRSNTATTSSAVLDNADDLVNFNKLKEESEGTTAVPPPIIAFEDRRQDVPDLLS